MHTCAHPRRIVLSHLWWTTHVTAIHCSRLFTSATIQYDRCLDHRATPQLSPEHNVQPFRFLSHPSAPAIFFNSQHSKLPNTLKYWWQRQVLIALTTLPTFTSSTYANPTQCTQGNSPTPPITIFKYHF